MSTWHTECFLGIATTHTLTLYALKCVCSYRIDPTSSNCPHRAKYNWNSTDQTAFHDITVVVSTVAVKLVLETCINHTRHSLSNTDSFESSCHLNLYLL